MEQKRLVRQWPSLTTTRTRKYHTQRYKDQILNSIPESNDRKVVEMITFEMWDVLIRKKLREFDKVEEEKEEEEDLHVKGLVMDK